MPLKEQNIVSNAPTHVEASILKPVMSVASDEETSGACVKSRQGIPEKMYLLGMNHPQEATSIELDNMTAHGTLTKNLLTKLCKAIDVRFSSSEIGTIKINLVSVGITENKT